MRKVIAADIAVSLSENRFTMGLLAIYLAMGMFTAFFRIFSVLFAVTLVMNVMAYNERSGFERFMAGQALGHRHGAICRDGGALRHAHHRAVSAEQYPARNSSAERG